MEVSKVEPVSGLDNSRKTLYLIELYPRGPSGLTAAG